MSLIGILLVIVGIWLALKVVGVFFKLALWVLVLVGAYLLLAPLLGLPHLF